MKYRHKNLQFNVFILINSKNAEILFIFRSKRTHFMSAVYFYYMHEEVISIKCFNT